MCSIARLLIQSHDVGTHFFNPVCCYLAFSSIAVQKYSIFCNGLIPYSVPANFQMVDGIQAISLCNIVLMCLPMTYRLKPSKKAKRGASPTVPMGIH